MAQIVTLSHGQTAELRAPEDVSERLRRPVNRAMRRIDNEKIQAIRNEPVEGTEEEKAAALASIVKRAGLTEDEINAMDDANDLAIVALVKRWDCTDEDGNALPLTLDGVLGLRGRDLDRLRNVVAPLVGDMFVDASPDPNPQAPIGGSNGSATPSPEDHSLIPLITGGPIS